MGHTALTKNINRIAKFELGGEGNLKWAFPYSTSLLIDYSETSTSELSE